MELFERSWESPKYSARAAEFILPTAECSKLRASLGDPVVAVAAAEAAMTRALPPQEVPRCVEMDRPPLVSLSSATAPPAPSIRGTDSFFSTGVPNAADVAFGTDEGYDMAPLSSTWAGLEVNVRLFDSVANA